MLIHNFHGVQSYIREWVNLGVKPPSQNLHHNLPPKRHETVAMPLMRSDFGSSCSTVNFTTVTPPYARSLVNK